MMGRIDSCFERLKKVGRKGLITYITAGDPDIDSTLEYMNILVESGADIIEIGVPFSDPIADGPTIQRASERALNNGIDLNSIFELVSKFRDKNIKILLHDYDHPTYKQLFGKFIPYASCLDLIFNEGHNSYNILIQGRKSFRNLE